MVCHPPSTDYRPQDQAPGPQYKCPYRSLWTQLDRVNRFSESGRVHMHPTGLRSVTLSRKAHHDIMVQPAPASHHRSDTLEQVPANIDSLYALDGAH
ncbi:hypothetical protein C8035_v003059 [Colletotrichum spinosum]|uniref:Uncharacterized protein n=1 Tax=Colletotrichum spinosum TaxID=1347390 RepID=A0A4R8PSJ3_9PEZI|nr:hypothetical protein C8035_v003059 [Colletotrichum spinosum]